MQFDLLSIAVKSPKTQPNRSIFFFRMKLVELSDVKWQSSKVDVNDCSTLKNKLASSIAKIHHDFSNNPITFKEVYTTKPKLSNGKNGKVRFLDW